AAQPDALRAPTSGQRLEPRALARPGRADYRDVDRQLCPVQLERLVENPDSLLDLFARDQACDADLGRADHLDVDTGIGTGAKHTARNAWRVEHAGAAHPKISDDHRRRNTERAAVLRWRLHHAP